MRLARKDRTGNRTTREQRAIRRIPEMGYYLVVTDTEATERCYFTGLHNSLPLDVQHKLVIKVVETKTQNLIQKCLELTAYEAQYRIPWIVFDRDEVIDFDKIIKEAKREGIHVGWSNPCFEIWMYTYFGNMIPRNVRIPESPDWPAMKFYRMMEPRYSMGIVEVKEDGNSFRIYDKEKTVCDVIYHRNKMGFEPAMEVLKRYVQQPDRDINRLIAYAKRLHVETTIKQYLEALL